MVSPFIKQITRNGTFFAFSSSEEDLSVIIGNSPRRIRFSKYALLDIPVIERPANGENFIQFDAIEGAYSLGLSTATPPPAGDRIDLSQSFQNYVLNLEILTRSQSTYKPSLLRNTSERIFFKWLKEIGAIRYREAIVGEKSATLTDKRFVEEDFNNIVGPSDLYNPVVKHIGEIDIQGVHRSSANAFSELYFYIPTESGSTPTVLFKTIEDENYFSSMSIKKTDLSSAEYIEGRDSSDNPSPAGLDIHAFYDMDVPAGGYDYTTNAIAGAVWFDPMAVNGPNAYFTDSSFLDPNNDEIIREDPSTILPTITYKRSRLDGVTIDFEKSDYKAFNDDLTLKTFGNFNNTALAESFDFNAILVYYDTFDISNPDVVETNLFGILFLNDMEVFSTSGAKVGSFKKYKPNTLLRENGNSYGVKLNIKTDVTADNVDVEVEVSVNDYNTFSMQLFSDTMQRMGLLSKNYEYGLAQIDHFKEVLDNLESLVFNDENKLTLLQKISALKEQFDLVGTNLSSATSLVDLINRNTQDIANILANRTPIQVTYLLSINGKDGIDVKKNLLNDFEIINVRQEYSFMTDINFDVQNGINAQNIIALNGWKTIYFHKNNGNSKTLQDNLHIFIDDTLPWKNGQSFVIEFIDPLVFSGFGIIVYTDVANSFNQSLPYRKLVGAVQNISSSRPSLEIICRDEKTYTFEIILRS